MVNHTIKATYDIEEFLKFLELTSHSDKSYSPVFFRSNA